MIIGILGFINSGKGTFADLLVKNHGFTKLSFADSLKDAISAIFGWQRNLLEGDTAESREFRETKDEWWSDKLGRDFTPRLALQLMGTEAMRDGLHPNIWIYSLERKIGMYNNVVIADVRFPNEIEAIKNMGGFVVRVTRGADPEWYSTALAENTSDELADEHEDSAMARLYPHVHYSEWAWIGQPVNYEFFNQGTIEMLGGDIKQCLKVFTGPGRCDTIPNLN
jgi:hypothetical protein